MAEFHLTDTQIKIVEAYLALSVKVGVENITLKKIAERARLSFTTVHYHYGAKHTKMIEDVITHVVRGNQRETASYLDEVRATQKEKFLPNAYVEVTLRWAEKYPTHCAFWIYFYHVACVHPHFRKINQGFIKTAYQRVETLLFESMGRGFELNPKSIPTLAPAIHRSVVGSVIHYLAHGEGDKTVAATIQATQQAIVRMAKGART